MIGRGPPPSVWSVTRAVIQDVTLCRQVLTDPAQILTQQPGLSHALIMLTLGTIVRSILSRLNRRHPLTDLSRELVQIITQVSAVMIRDLLLRGLSSLMHRINPALEPRRELLELHRDHTADRDPESRERGHDFGCGHDGHQRMSCADHDHWSAASRVVGVVASSHQSIKPVGFSAV